MTHSRTFLAFVLIAQAAVLMPSVAPAQVLGPARSGLNPSAAAADSRPMEALRSLGLTPVTALSREREHLEIEATTADGRRLWVSFDLSGRLWEIEDANHDKDNVVEWRDLDADTVRRFVTDAGFGFGRVLEEKPRHVVVRATTRQGANVILHLDRNGYIYKQIWPRG
jgi:YD repeat-containing protein